MYAYREVLSTPNEDDGLGNVPRRFQLAQNYPNPFNPTTQIAYELLQTSTVRLTIFNIHGQAIRALNQGLQTPGAYPVRWNGLDDAGQPVASGVYLYRLAAGAETQTRTMTLLR